LRRRQPFAAHFAAAIAIRQLSAIEFSADATRHYDTAFLAVAAVLSRQLAASRHFADS